MIGKFFHTPKPKQFNYRPRFYDPGKEELQDRERKIKREMGIVDEEEAGKPFSPGIKGQFRNTDGWKSKSSEDARRAQNTRLIMLIVILALVFYLFFYSDILG